MGQARRQKGVGRRKKVNKRKVRWDVKRKQDGVSDERQGEPVRGKASESRRGVGTGTGKSQDKHKRWESSTASTVEMVQGSSRDQDG